MDLLGGPGDLLLAGKKGAECFTEAGQRRPERNGDLDRHIVTTFSGAGRLEVDGCEFEIGDCSGSVRHCGVRVGGERYRFDSLL